MISILIVIAWIFLLTMFPFTPHFLTMKQDLVEAMSNTLIERFKVLINNDRDEDALSIMQEYILPNGEIEDDNYQWLIINDLTVLP